MHAQWVAKYQKNGRNWAIDNYVGEGTKTLFRPCPNALKYQFTDECKLKISDMCCVKMKEEPLQKWQKEHNKLYSILGIMQEEGGRRYESGCLVFKKGKLKSFQPLAKVTHDWEDWFIEKYGIQLCKLYYPPYNFRRTGCKGCPFALDLQQTLETLERYFPNERAQCEIIWRPVYDEYRRLGYRIKNEEQIKMF
jgi:3'-phosphoadenosine 5'-phosphosulfate sulfotransferase (PAPS reductase)/FAD synthetase